MCSYASQRRPAHPRRRQSPPRAPGRGRPAGLDGRRGHVPLRPPQRPGGARAPARRRGRPRRCPLRVAVGQRGCAGRVGGRAVVPRRAARAGRLRGVRPRDDRHASGLLADRRGRAVRISGLEPVAGSSAWSTRASRSRRRSRRSPASRRARARPPAHRERLRRVPALQRRGGARRAQRPLRRRVRRRRAAPPARRAAGGARHRHRRARPAPGRRPAAAHGPGDAGRALRHRGAPLPPGAARRRGDGRGAAAAARPGPGARRGDGRRGDRPVRAGAAAGSGRRGLAAGVPTGPGVYLFRDASERVLYVGKATDLRARVRSYFSGRALRAQVERAVEAAARVETRPLGLGVRGRAARARADRAAAPAREHARGRPDRACYLVLTLDEAVPRLRVSADRAGRATSRPGRCARAARPRPSPQRCATTFGLRVCRPALPGRRRLVPGRHDRHMPGAVPRRRRGRRLRRRGGRGPRVARGRRVPGPQERVRDADGRAERRSPLRAGGGGARPARRRWSAAGARWPACAGRPAAAGSCSRRTSTGVSCRRSPAPAAASSHAGACPVRATAGSRPTRSSPRSPTACAARRAPFSPAQADQARVVAAALARPRRAARGGGRRGHVSEATAAARPAAADGTLAGMNFGDRVAEAVERKQQLPLRRSRSPHRPAAARGDHGPAPRRLGPRAGVRALLHAG